MTSCGTTTHTDPDDYRSNVPGVGIILVLTSSIPFKARVVWIKLRRLTLVTVEEAAPHIAFLSLDPSRIHVTFPLHGEPVWGGVRLRRGDFIVHRTSERLHHRAEGGVRWGLISIPAKEFAAYGRALLDRHLTPPNTTRLLRPAWKTATEVLRLHATACRLAATKPQIMAHREVARSAEQELIVAVVNMLTSCKTRDRGATDQHRADIMARFEDALAAQPRQQRMSALCTAIGVPLRTLRICCKAFLGCGPLEYVRLQRLNQVRSALSKADHETATVAGIARSHGFSEPGRFAGSYRAVFGESPSATLLRTSAESA